MLDRRPACATLGSCGVFADRDPRAGLVEFERLQHDATGLELLRAQIPDGATRADARRLRDKILQTGRRPCTFLDASLGIRRG